MNCSIFSIFILIICFKYFNDVFFTRFDKVVYYCSSYLYIWFSKNLITFRGFQYEFECFRFLSFINQTENLKFDFFIRNLKFDFSIKIFCLPNSGRYPSYNELYCNSATVIIHKFAVIVYFYCSLIWLIQKISLYFAIHIPIYNRFIQRSMFALRIEREFY